MSYPVYLPAERIIGKTMLSIESETELSGPRITIPSCMGWLYLNLELLLGLGLSAFLIFLGIIKSCLPRPPRDLAGDVVLVTGATSRLGCSLVEEFARAGCSVILVDGIDSGVEELAKCFRGRYPRIGIENLTSRKQKKETELSKSSAFAYTCDLWDQQQVRALATKVRSDVGSLDVLVSCALTPKSESDVFDSVNRTLMSHYWMVLAFISSMLHRERGYVIGITPTKSTMDAFMGSKAALAGLMDSLTRQFNGKNNRLKFLIVAPYADPQLMKQSEEEIAKEMVHLVQRDQSYLCMNWSSKLLYNFCCKLHNGITTITKWFDA